VYRRLIFAAVFALFLAAALYGQSGNATVTGQVNDQSGAVIPGATIKIQNTETQVQQTSKSNAEGRYAIPNLIPGNYNLSAEVQGFKKFERPNFRLQVGDRVALDINMEIGSAGESVTVSAEVPLLRTEDAQAGLVIDNRRILELPQYNRNPLAFAQLAPNVTGSAQQGGHDNDFRINGGRTGQAEYFIDGVAVTTGYKHDVPPSVPSMEAIAEFKVVSNGMNAEFGRLSGGAVLVATKSGTNDIHGSALWFFRNDKLNANTWNSNRYGRAKGVFHDNIYGGSVGGPVRIPKVYNGKDKTFFFLAFEGTRNSSGTNAAFASVPTALERQGDFSQSLYNTRAVQIFDWTTGQFTNGGLVRQPFAGNRIPESRFNALAKIYMGYYPQANQAPQVGTTSTSNYVYSSTSKSSNGKWTGRLDENWNSSNATHVSMNRYDSQTETPRTFSKMQNVGSSWIESTSTTLEHVWTITPTTIFTARAGIVRLVTWSGSGVDPALDTSNWPVDSLGRNLIGTAVGRASALSMDYGPTTLGGGSVNDTREANYNAQADVQKLMGKHTIKAGFDHRRFYLNQFSGGNFDMSTAPMVTALNPGNQTVTGSPFASFLLGQPTWGSGTQWAGPASLQKAFGAFFQDDIKVTKKLSVNLGIRWDFEPSRTERFDRQVFWDTQYKWPWQPNAGWSWDSIKTQVGASNMPTPEWITNGIKGRVAMMGTPEYPGRTLVQNKPYRFSPRTSAAWQFLPKTVLRASYGINWLTVTGNSHINYAIWNVGFGDLARLPQDGSVDGGLTYLNSFTNPMPNANGYVRFTRDINYLNQQVMGNWWLSETDRFTQGHEHAIQLSLQREIGSGNNSWVVEAAFSGLYSKNLPFWIGLGEHVLPDAYHKIGGLGSSLLKAVSNPFYGRIPLSSSRGGQNIALGNVYQLNPLWQQISTTGDPIGTANYTAGYMQIEHRFGRGFSFLANYTMSKLMQDTGAIDNAFTQGFPQAGLGPADVYGLALTDRRHKLLFNGSFDVPFGRGRKMLTAPKDFAEKVLEGFVGGWTMAGTALYRSGTPLAIAGTDRLWWDAGQAGNGASERPVWVDRNYNPGVDGHMSLEGSAGYTPYVNIASFRKAKALSNLLEIGDLGTVIPMRGPGFFDMGFSLLKSFPLFSEGKSLQIRAEAENFMNTMNPTNPGVDITQPVSFGKITNQTGNPRRIMLSAKIRF
jgi:hypothetical protein